MRHRLASFTSRSRSGAAALIVGALLVARCSNSPAPTPSVDARVVPPDDVVVVDGAVADAGPRCISPADPTPLNGPCRCTSDCPDDTQCQTESVNGMPMGSCVRPCVSSADCHGASTCGASGLCQLTCTAADGCTPGEYCLRGRCLPFCQSDAECFSGHCNRWSGHCMADGSKPAGSLNHETCLRDADCRSLLCSGGRCEALCSLTAQGCPDGEVCVRVSAVFIDAGICRQRCEVGAACTDPSLTCRVVSGMTPTVRACQ